MVTEHTIVGIAAGSEGASAISIIRISGLKAFDIGQKVYPRLKPIPRQMQLGTLEDQQGQKIDQALIVFFKGPHSSTGEDIVEIHCHGGRVIIQKVLKICLTYGAILAKPGEFLYRGFWNEKYTIDQVEGISVLINAQTESALRHGVAALHGKAQKWVQNLQSELRLIQAWIEGCVDFSDQDSVLEDTFVLKAQELLNNWIGRVEKEIRQIQARQIAIKGVQLCLAGPPNAGKSSFLNWLSGEDLSIVDDQPGTTRDVVRSHIEIGGIPVHVCDTAGLRSNVDNNVEKRGIEKTKKILQTSQVIVYMIPDGQAVDFSMLEEWKDLPAYKILVKNKIDLTGGSSGRRPLEYDFDLVLGMSVADQNGMAEWTKCFLDLFQQESFEETTGLSSLRQEEALQLSLNAARNALCQLSLEAGIEIAAYELTQAANALSLISGTRAHFSKTDAVFDEIFSRLCIGK